MNLEEILGFDTKRMGTWVGASGEQVRIDTAREEYHAGVGKIDNLNVGPGATSCGSHGRALILASALMHRSHHDARYEGM